VIQTFDFPTPAGTLRMERTYTEVNVEGLVADEKWRFTDSNGHEHAYGETRGDRYPTLRYVVDEWCYRDHGLYGGSDPDGHPAAGHYECLQCGETIRPGSREARNPERLVLTSVATYLNGEYVPKEEAERILGEAKTAHENDGKRYEYKL
jgi:hypothetical protein